MTTRRAASARVAAGEAFHRGRDVIPIHRLLKKDVSKVFGAHAHALYFGFCVRTVVGIGTGEQSLVEHSEAIEHILWGCHVARASHALVEKRRLRRRGC
jgi:hypothetical protein